MNLIKIATVVLIAGAAVAHAQSSAPITSTTSSTTSGPAGNQVKAAPVQIKPKTKPSPAAATSTTPADKGHAPALKIVEKPAQSSVAKSGSVTAKPVAATAAAAKSSAANQKTGNAVAARPTTLTAKPVLATQQASKAAVPAASQPAKSVAKTTAPVKANVAASNQKSSASAPTQKPTAATPGTGKATVAAKTATPAASSKRPRPKPASVVAIKSAKPGTPARRPAKGQVKPAFQGKISAVEQPMKSAAAPATTEQAAAPAPRKIERAGRRDPFVSPIQSRSIGSAGSCATGKRCLDIEQVVLKGIVRTRDGNMALVENASRRPYVLRENDALFNGTVEKITGDSVLFRQNVQDLLGHTSTREVIKRVSAPAV